VKIGRIKANVCTTAAATTKTTTTTTAAAAATTTTTTTTTTTNGCTAQFGPGRVFQFLNLIHSQ
jgi:hypothetical protein